jgi:hypothetical protein
MTATLHTSGVLIWVAGAFPRVSFMDGVDREASDESSDARRLLALCQQGDCFADNRHPANHFMINLALF